ncbi:MAG: ADP-ribosylglycohydrolase family protein [Clostridia bacterium]|nr:ADP-ribosylglycohydrolase family protein [Clostridia bacterium]
MIGAIIGDIAGSKFEFCNYRSKKFKIFSQDSFITDDSVMTLAVAQAVYMCKGDYTFLSGYAKATMQMLGQMYPSSGYGTSFYNWIFSDHPLPYNSYGNGAAMRVSACGFYGKTLNEVKKMSKAVTEVSHNHPEGLKGAEATAVCIYLAKSGKSKKYIRNYVNKNYYKLDFTIDEIRPTYDFNETCQRTVPQAIEAFLESESFEDAIKTAVSVGGDSDTLAAITGSIAEAFYGVPADMRAKALEYLDEDLLQIYNNVEIILK